MRFETLFAWKKSILVFGTLCLLFASLGSNCLAEDSIVFQAIPSKLFDKNLQKQEAVKYSIVIKKVGGKYIWVSRNDTPLSYSASGIYHVFTAENGSGFISIVDNRKLVDIFRPKGSPDIEYGEHIRNGIGIISYYGTGDFIAP